MIFLIGYMACGKTTLGRALEAAGAGTFIDLDEEIERHTSLSPRQWFATHGEASFRRKEREVLEAVCRTHPHTILATGGGTPCSPETMDFMLAHGLVVWLEASLERTVTRLLEADGQRPLVAGKSADQLRQFIPEHLEARKAFYGRAHVRFDSSRLDTQAEIDATVNDFINSILPK